MEKYTEKDAEQYSVGLGNTNNTYLPFSSPSFCSLLPPPLPSILSFLFLPSTFLLVPPPSISSSIHPPPPSLSTLPLPSLSSSSSHFLLRPPPPPPPPPPLPSSLVSAPAPPSLFIKVVHSSLSCLLFFQLFNFNFKCAEKLKEKCNEPLKIIVGKKIKQKSFVVKSRKYVFCFLHLSAYPPSISFLLKIFLFVSLPPLHFLPTLLSPFLHLFSYCILQN